MNENEILTEEYETDQQNDEKSVSIEGWGRSSRRRGRGREREGERKARPT